MDCNAAAIILEDVDGHSPDAVRAATHHVRTCPDPECEARDFVEADALLRLNPHLLIDSLEPDPSFDKATMEENPADRERHAHETEEASARCLVRLREEGLLPPETATWKQSKDI